MDTFLFKKNKFFAALSIESAFNNTYRKLIANILSVSIVMFAFLLVYGLLQPLSIWLSLPTLVNATILLSVMYLLIGIRIVIFTIDRFINSTTYDKHGEKTSNNLAQRFNYFAAQLWFYSIYAKTHPSLWSFLVALPQTEIGAHILRRLGVSMEEFNDFLADYKQEISIPFDQMLAALSSIPRDRDITAADIIIIIFNQDRNFRDFMIAKFTDEHIIYQAITWVEQIIANDDQNKRWWSREKLGRIQGMGKTWAYGPVFTLMQFAKRIENDSSVITPFNLTGHENEIKLLEHILLSNRNANAMVVGQPGAGKETLILGLTQMILQGTIFPELESKRIFTISGPAIIAKGKTKGDIEAILITLLNEAARAGDIILVIQQFPEFIESLNNAGIIASQIFEPYLISNTIHIIALADTTPFRKHVESNAAMMAHFEKIEILEPDEKHLLLMLQHAASHIEAQARTPIIFTYPALINIAEASLHYLVEGALPERAINVMQELINFSLTRHVILIGPELVAEYIGKKTKMPLGAISKEEREKLVNLEDQLHERVINQREAIGAIANTIRRARAGISEPKRPIGSFLFLGPTGVGKTETAKALAFVYFGDENTMTRFDMTEYQTTDAMERLIGSFDKNEPGILASRMRSSPYGILLLDEFEKADKKVIDLFLQILDEGFFSDAFGQQVNMRNTIIIATSNAGAQLIWRWVESGIDPSAKKSEIVAEIQQQKHFKPELLNRFDALIIFQPLSQENLKQIARMMLKKLAHRLKEQKNIIFTPTDELIDETIRQGYDPAFGARPMRRFIQDKIEKIIAEKIIKNELGRGGSITLSAEDIA